MSGEGVAPGRIDLSGASLAKYASHAAFCGWHIDQRDSDCPRALAPPVAGKVADVPDPVAGKVFELPEGFEISGRVFGDRVHSGGVASCDDLYKDIISRDEVRTRERELFNARRYPSILDRCGTRHKADWFCTRAEGHHGPCAALPLTVEAAETQSRTDSLMESLTNIVIGLAISQAANLVVIPLVMGVPISAGQNAALALLYTAISLVRSYAIRRAFNGRSVWSAIKARLA